MPNDSYILIDTKKHRRERNVKLCEAIAKTALKYGHGGVGLRKYREHLGEFWTDELRYPTATEITHNLITANIKWYIHNYLQIQGDSVWNADFLHGLCTNGTIERNAKRFSSFRWFNNNAVTNLIQQCPFGGTIHHSKNKNRFNRWNYVPALSLKYSTNSISFFAGVLAGGQIGSDGKSQWAEYKGNTTQYLRQWKIPIEKTIPGRRQVVGISSFWPALFSIRMPADVASIWTNLKGNDIDSMYAALMWNAYMHEKTPSNRLPFGVSRRTIYSHYKCEEGATAKLARMRIEQGLSELDTIIGDTVKLWDEPLNKEKQNEVSIH